MSEENQGEYRLTLTGPGITIDKIVDPRTAGAIAQMTLSGVELDHSHVSVGDRLRPVIAGSSGQRISLREYLQTAAPDRGIHTKILAVGGYLRDMEGQS